MKFDCEHLQLAVQRSFEKNDRTNFNGNCEEAKVLAKDGLLIIHDFLEPNVCDGLATKVRGLVNGAHWSEDGVTTLGGSKAIDRGKKFSSDTNMIDIFDVDNAINELDRTQPLYRRITNIINSASIEPLTISNCNVYVNRGIKPRILHIDQFFNNQFKAFIYFTDVLTLDDGPFMYVKGSHLCSSKKINSFITNYENGSYRTDMPLYDYDEAHACLGERGTLIISDQNGVHGAHPQPIDKERILLMLNYSKHKIDPR